jgi:arylsulfatase A
MLLLGELAFDLGVVLTGLTAVRGCFVMKIACIQGVVDFVWFGVHLLHKLATQSIWAVTLLLCIYPHYKAFSADLASRPNIVIIMADDMGWGDPKCYNPEGKIATPGLDRMAKEGMIFRDAHSGSSVCTPTRYGILTGRYAWRTKLQNGVLGGYSPPLIAADRLTVPSLLRQHGYATHCIGKWHLGMEWLGTNGEPIAKENQAAQIDYSKAIQNGPITRGFDHYFGISASLDMPPYIWIKQDRTVGLPTVKKKWLREGVAHPDFEAIDVLPELTKTTISTLKAAAQNKQPFFIYLPLASPHTPIEVASAFQGKSGINPYADFVMQTDAAVGEILKALDELKLADNTLVIFTSDNGCSPAAKIDELLAKQHAPNGPWRGHKADIFEGGHRVPFLVRWPAQVKAGLVSNQTICLTDLMATCAELVNAKLPDNAGEDSFSFLPALQGKLDQPLRPHTIHHSIQGMFAIRQGDWKLCLGSSSGGWSEPKPNSAAAKKLPKQQLFHLGNDPAEQVNLIDIEAKQAQQMLETLSKIVKQGRSTKGTDQMNDVEVNFLKGSAE